jgi:hypothetical protein
MHKETHGLYGCLDGSNADDNRGSELDATREGSQSGFSLHETATSGTFRD